MKKVPHKHAALIKAWADGALIEWRWIGEWHPCATPAWSVDSEYRIKPEPNPDYLVSAYGYTKDVLDKVMLLFDGETGKLKATHLKDS